MASKIAKTIKKGEKMAYQIQDEANYNIIKNILFSYYHKTICTYIPDEIYNAGFYMTSSDMEGHRVGIVSRPKILNQLMPDQSFGERDKEIQIRYDILPEEDSLIYGLYDVRYKTKGDPNEAVHDILELFGNRCSSILERPLLKEDNPLYCIVVPYVTKRYKAAIKERLDIEAVKGWETNTSIIFVDIGTMSITEEISL